MDDQKLLIAAFLSQYLTAGDDHVAVPPKEPYLRAGVQMLVTDGVMTIEEIRMEALRNFNVIIPWYYFEERVET